MVDVWCWTCREGGGCGGVEEGWMLRENVCGGKVVDVEEVWMWREVEC